jgi:DNA-binding CsgD family transcriptional regulator/tetratricopeptide (TPR) repeat protein
LGNCLIFGRRDRPMSRAYSRGEMGAISSLEFIGRSEESRALARALGQARRGATPTVFVAGEAGIGKSRLLDEFSAAADGARVLVGHCAPLGVSPPPLTPVVGALRAYVRSVAHVERAQLARVAPGLTRLLPELAGSNDDWRGEHEQVWVFDLLLSALETLAAERPLVLAIEDVHWADQSTLDLVAYRARTRRVPGCVVVATYRNEELPSGHALRLLLGELARSPGVETIKLRPFDRDELVAQMTAILDAPPDDDVVADVVARSDGNPFFAEELLAAGQGHAASGSTLQDVLLARIESLPERTQTILRILAVARRSLVHQALAAVSGTADEELEPIVRDAVDRAVIVATRDGAYAFRHALLQEATYERLLPQERVRLHGELARAIDAHLAMSGDSDPQILADLAHHWQSAGDLARALTAGVQAGRAAEAIYAHAEALAQYERALQLWDAVSEPEQRAAIDRVELRARAAEAAGNRGDSARAALLVQDAIEDAKADADPTRTGVLTERLGRYRWVGGETAAALKAFENAAALIPSSPPSIARARVLAALAHALLISGQVAAAHARATEARDVAQAASASVEEARALSTLGAAADDVDEGLRLVRDGRRLLERAGAPSDCIFITNGSEFQLLEHASRLEDAVDVAQAGISFTGRRGMQRNHQAWLETLAASALIRLGKWAQAEAILEQAIAKEPIGITRLAVQLSRAELQLARGELAAAEETVADGLGAVRGDHPLAGKRFDILAALDLARRRFDAARTQVEQGLVALEQVEDAAAHGRLCWRGIEVEATRAERARAARKASEHETAAAVAAKLLDHARLVASGRPENTELTALVASCEAELGRAQGDPNDDAWLKAAASWEARCEPYAAAYCRVRAAEAALSRKGPKTEAAASLRLAHATAERLHAVSLLETVESLARRARIELAPPPAAPQPVAPAVDSTPHGLTPRELQVLRLVARGYTNPQIAGALFISRKTAGAHVSNILSKLGVARRVEAAAMAERLDLLGDQTPEQAF